MSTPTAIQACAALYGIVPSASFVSEINSQISSSFGGSETAALNFYYGVVWGNNTSESVAARIVANLGLTGEEAASETTRMAAVLDATPVDERGGKVKDLIDAFELLTTPAATAFKTSKDALVTAVADPFYQGIAGKNVVFSSISVEQIQLGTDAPVTKTALKLGAETVTGSTGIDLITASTSGLSANRTLDTTDVIAGGEGSDQLTVTMDGAFAGFSSPGAMTSVEKLELINQSVISRSFDATGVTGLTSIKLNATVGDLSLADLPETGITVSLIGQDSNDLNIAFATVSATDDSLTLDLGGGIGATSAVSLNSAGIETIQLVSSGSTANKVEIGDLSTAAKTVTVSGTAGLTLTRDALTAAMTSVDASKATGAFIYTNGTTAGLTSILGSQGANTITSTATTGTLASVVGGSGIDTFTFDSGTLRADATVSGGDGVDTLSLSTGGARTLQVSMSGVEGLAVGALSGALTFDGAKVSGLSTITLGAIASNVSLTNSAVADVTVAMANTASNTSGVLVSVDNAGKTTGSLTSTATTAVTNNVGLTASKATDLAFNAGTGVTYQGTVTATKATSVTLSSTLASTTLASGLGTGTTDGVSNMTLSAPVAEVITVNSNAQLNADISAPVATSATITHAGTSSAYVDVQGSKLEQLTVTSAKPMNLTSSSLPLVQILNVTGSEGAVTLPALPKLVNGTFSGTGTTTGKLSTLTTLDITSESLTLTASGFKGGGSVGAIAGTAGASLNFDGLTSTTAFAVGTVTSSAGSITVQANGSTTPIITTGDLSATAGTATVNIKQATTGSFIGANANNDPADVDITAKTVNYTGPFTIASNITATTAATSGAFNVTVNGGLAADTFHIQGTAGLTSIVVSGDLSIADAGAFDRVFIDPAASSATAVSIDASGIVGTSATTKVVIGNPNGTIDLAKPSTIKGSSYSDFINVPLGKTTITGGAGDDVFHFADTGTDQTFNPTAVYNSAAGTAVYTLHANSVVIADFNVGKDLLSFEGQAAAPTITTFTTLPTASPANGNAQFIPGSYNSSTGVFTYAATGTQTLFFFADADGSDYAVVLDAYTHTAAKQDATSAVTIVAAVAEASGNAAFTGVLGVA